ncbi:FAD-containing oxidoreductase [Roseixanthobacter glucoisosaccharinicivorans]|uniref:FAD-containing oxidoreductase n=1 Tax=Roseixanthobacter glucoisosaccharinicivorans TaxID=3119923 RepID=UPI0037281C84
MTQTFDAIIIGAGQAGPPLAGRLTGAGMKVALIERHLIGGTCVNTGCMPTKALVASAYAAHMARRAADFGVIVPGEVGIDMTRVHARAHQVTMNARNGLTAWMEAMAGLTLFHGHARFESPTAVRVGEDLLTAPRVFINVGGRALVPDMPGLADIDYLTNTSMLDLDVVPRHLVVVGGSYIGLEFAQAFRRFGAEVTVLEKGPRLVAREDEDISAEIARFLAAEGIKVRTGIATLSFSRAGAGVNVRVEGDGGAPDLVASHVLVAIGRVPNTGDLGLDAAGIERDERGYIRVDDTLQTNVSGVWAMGDCNGRGAFTHTAYNDFEIIAANLLDGADRRLSARISAYALYTDPPLGRVGMSEAQARASGRPLLVSTRPMARVGRAVEKGETIGFMKMVVDAQTKRILGAAILGTSGDEAIHGILDMMNADQPYDVLQWAVPIHPTVSELIPTLIGDLKPAA